jgi:hypothetical protein
MKTTDWVRVNKHNPCLVCGKTDWCRLLSDGTPICSRIPSPIRYDNGGWIHKLQSPHPLLVSSPKIVSQGVKASFDVINQTYGTLLTELTLSTQHREKLLKRGLSESQIILLNYKTMPLYGRDDVIKKLLTRGIQLKGIPGFWTNPEGRWRLSGPLGICIPVRDLQGNIQGITIRCDNTLTGKYKWLSSALEFNGCSSGVSMHVAKPEEANLDEVWITEGPLKADICSIKLNKVVLAVPGVGCWNKAVPIIQELKPKRTIVAFDMDKNNKPGVELFKNLLIRTLLRIKIKVYEADWDSQFKGLDDLLTAKG